MRRQLLDCVEIVAVGGNGRHSRTAGFEILATMLLWRNSYFLFI